MPKISRPRVHSRPPVAGAVAGIKWKGRGPFKCVKNGTVSCRGVHPALLKAYWPTWNWDKAKADGSLQDIALPVEDKVVPMPEEARARRLPYSKGQGIRFDAEITKTVKLSRTNNLPACFWFNKSQRTLILAKLKGPTEAAQKTVARLRNAIKVLMPETMAFWKLMHDAQMVPVETQTPVAKNRVGTKLDVLCTHAVHTDTYRVIECKHGCEKNWAIAGVPNLPSSLPLTERRVTTHNQHLLQTTVNQMLFKATFPNRKSVKPWLVRVDRHGAHVYVAPVELEGLARLLG